MEACLLRSTCYFLSLSIHRCPTTAMQPVHRHSALIILQLFVLLFRSILGSRSSSDCSCGYYDFKTSTLYTETSIAYFNESEIIAADQFIPESYTHSYERSWNVQYREGASPSNVAISGYLSSNDSQSNQSLELRVEPSKANHVVMGGGLKTTRQDIQYGSFRALMRSPAQWVGGSALSLSLKFNRTQTVSLNVQNANDPSAASVTMLQGEDFPDPKYRIGFSNMTSGSFGNGTISPWGYTEYRIDWTPKELKFFIGDHLARTVRKSNTEEFFTTPSPLYIQHWSNGNPYSSQGPPEQPTFAGVLWLRMFFNSSSMTESEHLSFNERCGVSQACSVDDMTLRNSSLYPQRATRQWKQAHKPRPTRWFTIWIAVTCILITISVLVGPLWDRTREKVNPHKKEHALSSTGHYCKEVSGLSDYLDPISAISKDRFLTEGPIDPPPVFKTNKRRTHSLSIEPLASLPIRSPPKAYQGSRIQSLDAGLYLDKLSTKHNLRGRSSSESTKTLLHECTARHTQPSKTEFLNASNEINSRGLHRATDNAVVSIEEIMGGDFSEEPIKTANQYLRRSWRWSKLSNRLSARPQSTILLRRSSSEMYIPVVDPPINRTRTAQQPGHSSVSKPRVDHLAGLATICTLLVTAIHFALTFVAGSVEPGTFTHYSSEVVARNSVSTMFLNIIWIGPFLSVSAHFLTNDYLRTGDFLPLADKVIRRTFRLIVPIAAVALIQYFLIDSGATNRLEYLSSVTWSTWPFMVEYTDFGKFMTEILELAYLIPNAVPRITFNYCAGALWTIPVQLQGSWLILLAAIVVREIKKPWKRFGFYGFCVVNHWYALSWGSYFYLGMMLVDLDATYKWRRYLHSRPLFYYPLLTFCLALSFAALMLDLITQWTGVNYATFSYGIHPDPTSGLPISQAGLLQYPPYYVPRLNGLAFTIGLQAAVELSPMIQRVLSCKPLMRIFPHIFTIYLFHGFVFWSLGSWLCITLSVHGIAYWANVLAVAALCYTTIAIGLPLMTPLVETLGMTVAKDIWQYAREEPARKRPTLHPFSKSFLLVRHDDNV